MENSGEKFLHQKFSDLHKSEPVRQEQERQIENQESDNNHTKEPDEKIADWLKIIEKTHGHRDNPKKMEIIKEYYRNEYVIKPENIPESYYENQKRLAREQGRGDIEITPEAKKQLAEVITNDQKSTLDNWVNYFNSSDADAYPMWAKYWAFRSMLKLSSFDKEKKAFGTRRKDTVAPFPDLNREALAYVVDIINKKINKENIPPQEGNSELEKLIRGENFGKLYAYAIEKVTPTETNELLITEGEWIKYPKNSDHMPLVESLQGHGTGWCTAGESTAKTQLEGGDFYVYYSKDKSGKPTIPRVAIRMNGEQIGEVRGIAHEQNLDPYIGEIVDKKLSEFPDKEKYQKKMMDMKLLTQIDKKQKENKELSLEELKFLYEIKSKEGMDLSDFKFSTGIDSEIEGFGYKKDPRIEEIREQRDKHQDYALMFNCQPDQVEVFSSELKETTLIFIGDLHLRFGQLEKKANNQLIYIRGNLDCVGSEIEKIEANHLRRIDGNVTLESSEIKELPASLQIITGNVRAGSKLEKWGPDKFMFIGGNLNIINTKWEVEEPDVFIVQGRIYR